MPGKSVFLDACRTVYTWISLDCASARQCKRFAREPEGLRMVEKVQANVRKNLQLLNWELMAIAIVRATFSGSDSKLEQICHCPNTAFGTKEAVKFVRNGYLMIRRPKLHSWNSTKCTPGMNPTSFAPLPTNSSDTEHTEH